jgi:hypothetical protein
MTQRPVPCALRFDGFAVYLQDSGKRVAKAGFFTPIALGQIIQGDSARLHARQYEAGIRQSVRYTFASAFAVASAIWLGRAFDCRPSINIGMACKKSGGVAYLTAGGLLVTSFALEFRAVDHREHGRREGKLAVAWHNAMLPR